MDDMGITWIEYFGSEKCGVCDQPADTEIVDPMNGKRILLTCTDHAYNWWQYGNQSG